MQRKDELLFEHFAKGLREAIRIPTTSYQHVFDGLMDCI